MCKPNGKTDVIVKMMEKAGIIQSITSKAGRDCFVSKSQLKATGEPPSKAYADMVKLANTAGCQLNCNGEYEGKGGITIPGKITSAIYSLLRREGYIID